jgi:hypothetical protein
MDKGEAMIRVQFDKSAFLGGFGLYVSKKTWNLTKNGTWFGPSFVIHISNRMIRIYWKIKEK